MTQLLNQDGLPGDELVVGGELAAANGRPAPGCRVDSEVGPFRLPGWSWAVDSVRLSRS